MKDLPAIRGRQYIASLVAEGEHAHQDFKYSISDARKIARSISAFSNAGGGRLLIGVKDNGVIAGVRSEEDLYVVEQAAGRYCRPAVEVEFTAFRTDASTVVFRASVPQAAARPVRCQHPDGSWHAYYRVADENILAHPLMVRHWQDDSAAHVRLDSELQALLAHIEHCGPAGLRPEDVAPLLGISARRAASLVLRLLRAGLLQFAYHGQHWHLVQQLPGGA